jgi:peptidyl-dipeptidase A
VWYSTPMTDFTAFLAIHRRRVEDLEIAVADSWWKANTEATPENETRAAEAQKQMTRVYADKESYQAIKAVDAAGLGPEMARQYIILLNAFTGNQMDDAVIEELVDTEKRVESAYNNYRPLLRGEPTNDNALRDVLRAADDAELRREAWEAGKEIGSQVEADVLRLVRLRNQEAQRLGFANYYAMALTLQEQDQDALFGLLDSLKEQTDPLWQTYKAKLDEELAAKFGVAVANLRPWHYADPFFQEAPPDEANLDGFYKGKNLEALTVSLFDAMGLDVRDILGRSDLYEREGKNQHAFCLHVGRFDDVRVLCNLTDSEWWMGTLLHEFGHAVYDKYLGNDLPFFLREVAHTLTTEAIAMFFGRLSRNAAFLQQYVGVGEEEAQAVAATAAEGGRAALLILTRWVLVMTHFERAMYENPDQDLNRLWWELVKRFQWVNPPDSRNAPDWAAKLHLALAPVYYQNYLLGEMMASQTLEYIRRQVLPPGSGDAALITSPAVGEYLNREIFAPGARLHWNTLIAKATGEPLNPEYFVGHLRREKVG